jgi:hypothetical protein
MTMRLCASYSCYVIISTLTCTDVLAQSSLVDRIDTLRRERGSAIVRANLEFEEWLDGAIDIARQRNNNEELTRLQVLKEQIHAETAVMSIAGDKRALLPTTPAQLRALLIGTKWSRVRNPNEVREFHADETFRSGPAGTQSAQFLAVSGTRVRIVWNSSLSIDCDFNADYTTMQELGGRRATWRKVP